MKTALRLCILTLWLATGLLAQGNQRAASDGTAREISRAAAQTTQPAQQNNPFPPPSDSTPRFEIAWTEKAPLPVPLYVLGGKVTTVDGKIYVIGGRSKEYPDSVFTFEFDPDKNTWTRKTDVPFKHHLLQTVALDGRIFVVGEGMQKNYVYDVIGGTDGPPAWTDNSYNLEGTIVQR